MSVYWIEILLSLNSTIYSENYCFQSLKCINIFSDVIQSQLGSDTASWPDLIRYNNYQQGYQFTKDGRYNIEKEMKRPQRLGASE